MFAQEVRKCLASPNPSFRRKPESSVSTTWTPALPPPRSGNPRHAELAGVTNLISVSLNYLHHHADAAVFIFTTTICAIGAMCLPLVG